MKKINNNWECPYCKDIFPRRIDLIEHKRVCEKGPKLNIRYIIVDGKRKYAPGCTSWNAGHTGEDDPRLKAKAEKLKKRYEIGELISPNLGKKHSEETKKKISESRKRYLAEHPDKVPYVLNHHSKGDSYPEKYFMSCFDNALIKYEKDYRALSYFLDFAWPASKCYIEVDGEQHYLDKEIMAHDIMRSKNLEDAGWICLERIRWKSFKKLEPEDQKKFVQELITKIRDFTKF